MKWGNIIDLNDNKNTNVDFIVYRIQRRPQLMQKLEKIENFSSIWSEEGRLALPRLLFIFRDNRPRSIYSKLSPDELSNSVSLYSIS